MKNKAVKGPTMAVQSAKEFRRGKAAAKAVLDAGGGLESSIKAAQEHFAKYEDDSEVLDGFIFSNAHFNLVYT